MNRRQRRKRQAAAKAAPSGAGGGLENGVKAHRAGRLEEARAIYRRVLAAAPDHPDALHLLGLVAHQSGDHGTAAELIGKAIAAQPGVDRFHNSLGLALAALGRAGAAEASYGAALALNPRHVEAHTNLGNLLADGGRLDEAEASYRRALAANPRYAPAHNNLGNVLKQRDALEEAADCYRRALAIKPDYDEALHNLAVALTPIGQLDEAEASCRKALAARPDFAAAHNSLGTILKFRGDLDGAKASYRRALDIKPDLVSARHSLAQFKTFREGDPEFAFFEDLAQQPDLAIENRILVDFALGKMYADIGDHDRAFASYRRGNEASREQARRLGRGFDAAAHGRRIAAAMAVQNAAFFAERRNFGVDSERPVFIVGMPRSGTSLVEQIVASHPAAAGAGELMEMTHVVDRLASETAGGESYPEGLAALDEADARRLAEGYLERLRAVSADAMRVTDKMPGNVHYLGVIALLLPKARVIHCLRDPMDTCISCYFNNFRMGNELTNDLADLGAYYREYERLMAHWRDVLPLAVLDVRYEDLIADQEAVSREIIAFLGLEWDARCLDFHATERSVRTSSYLQVREKIHARSVGRWKAYEDHLGPLIDALRLAAVPRLG